MDFRQSSTRVQRLGTLMLVRSLRLASFCRRWERTKRASFTGILVNRLVTSKLAMTSVSSSEAYQIFPRSLPSSSRGKDSCRAVGRGSGPILLPTDVLVSLWLPQWAGEKSLPCVSSASHTSVGMKKTGGIVLSAPCC